MKTKTLILLAICSTHNVAFSLPHNSTKELYQSPQSNIGLGGGFLQNAQLPLYGDCLASKSKIVKSFQKDIKLSHSIDSNQLAKVLNINLEAKSGWGKFSSSAAVDYINRIKNDDYSLSFNYQSVVYGNVALDISDYYGVNALNAGAAAAYNSSPDDFIKRCGDSYIRQMDLGAVLNVTMRIRFSTQEQKKKFEASFEGKMGDVISASANVKKEIERSHFKGTIDVIAFQAGGNPGHLDRIFGLDQEHHIVRCNLTNLDACAKAIDDVINYAQANGRWSEIGFSNQIQLKKGRIEADSLIPINLNEATISSYSDDFGLDIARVIPSIETFQARERLNKLYDHNSEMASFAKAVTHSAGFSHLTEKRKKELGDLTVTLQANLGVFKDGKSLDCFLPSTQHTCKNIVDDIEAALTPVDYHQFELLKGAYYVNMNYNWPLLFIRKPGGDMSIFNTDLIDVGVETNGLKLTPSYDYSYISLGGGYTTYSKGIQTRYYMDYYGTEDLVYQNSNGIGYIGNIPWNTCVNGTCYKAYYAMEIIPF